jgi:hypothetical protein
MLKTRPNSQKVTANKRTVIAVAPILPGKTEAWRRFMQEMSGARRQAYQASRRRLGIQAEQAWIRETRRWAIGIIIIETASLAEAMAALATSDDPFDCWFREQLLALQGLDLTRLDIPLQPELIFAWEEKPVLLK